MLINYTFKDTIHYFMCILITIINFFINTSLLVLKLFLKKLKKSIKPLLSDINLTYNY